MALSSDLAIGILSRIATDAGSQGSGEDVRVSDQIAETDGVCLNVYTGLLRSMRTQNVYTGYDGAFRIYRMWHPRLI